MKSFFSGAALVAALLLPAAANAAPGYATTNVNMRSGPSTRYPAVVVVPAGATVEIHGCLEDANWCDVSFAYGRGWVSGTYVQTVYRQNRVYLAPEYYRPLGIPTVTFELGNYWDRNYRNRDFYRERNYWRDTPNRYDRAPGRYIRDRQDSRLRNEEERDRRRVQQLQDRQRIDDVRDRRRDEEQRLQRQQNRIDNRIENRIDNRIENRIENRVERRQERRQEMRQDQRREMREQNQRRDTRDRRDCRPGIADC